jgi:hypothetical protein
MQRLILAMVLLASAVSTAWASQSLVGTWSLNGQPYMALNKDGNGLMQSGSFTWEVQGKNLIISSGGVTSILPYRLDGSVLTLQYQNIPYSLQRMGSASTAGQNKSNMESGGNAKAQSDQLSKLLLSSAWCTFKYNKISGASSATRFQFFNNGTYSNSGRSETYSSGSYGSMAGQHDSDGRGQWAVRSGHLYVSNPPEQPNLQPMPLTVTRNSSGYPILNSDGVEYSMCQ